MDPTRSVKRTVRTSDSWSTGAILDRVAQGGLPLVPRRDRPVTGVALGLEQRHQLEPAVEARGALEPWWITPEIGSAARSISIQSRSVAASAAHAGERGGTSGSARRGPTLLFAGLQRFSSAGQAPPEEHVHHDLDYGKRSAGTRLRSGGAGRRHVGRGGDTACGPVPRGRGASGRCPRGRGRPRAQPPAPLHRPGDARGRPRVPAAGSARDRPPARRAGAHRGGRRPARGRAVTPARWSRRATRSWPRPWLTAGRCALAAGATRQASLLLERALAEPPPEDRARGTARPAGPCPDPAGRPARSRARVAGAGHRRAARPAAVGGRARRRPLAVRQRRCRARPDAGDRRRRAAGPGGGPGGTRRLAARA